MKKTGVTILPDKNKQSANTIKYSIWETNTDDSQLKAIEKSPVVNKQQANKK